MKWIKIDPTQRIPSEDIIVTNGKIIAVQFENIRSRHLVPLKNMTHYIFLKDIPLPKDSE